MEAIWRSIARHEVHHPSPRLVAWGIRPAGLGRKPANFQNWLLHAGNRKKRGSRGPLLAFGCPGRHSLEVRVLARSELQEAFYAVHSSMSSFSSNQ